MRLEGRSEWTEAVIKAAADGEGGGGSDDDDGEEEEATLELANNDESKDRWVRVMEASGDGGEVKVGKGRPGWVLEGTAPGAERSGDPLAAKRR